MLGSVMFQLACAMEFAEFKCPFTKAGVHLEEACKDKDFCSSIVDGKVQLKCDHPYYHQVQLQLLVAADLGVIHNYLHFHKCTKCTLF